MKEQRRSERELEPPPIADQDPTAVEVLRVWATDDGPQQFSLESTWKEPEAWGLLLADLARHAARAYEREGHEYSSALAGMFELFQAEMNEPTDEPEQFA